MITDDEIGTAKSALDVLAGVTSEYLFNVGKTIKLVSEKFSNKMTAEVSVLHSLLSPISQRELELILYRRKLSYIHYLRVGLRKYRTWRDTLRMTWSGMVPDSETWRRSL